MNKLFVILMMLMLLHAARADCSTIVTPKTSPLIPDIESTYGSTSKTEIGNFDVFFTNSDASTCPISTCELVGNENYELIKSSYHCSDNTADHRIEHQEDTTLK